MAKTYMDIGLGRISWFTAKFPELMAISYFMKSAGIEHDLLFIFLLGCCIAFCLTVFGYFWKKTGLLDVELTREVLPNVVQSEIYEAAKVINKKFGEKK